MTYASEHEDGKRRRRVVDPAREYLKLLRLENPKADRAALTRFYLDRVRSAIEDGDEILIKELTTTPITEWLSANIVEPRAPRVPSEKQRAEKTALVEQIAARDVERVEAIVTRRLLEWELMNGRALGDLTGAECRNFAERYGVFFHVISEQIPARAKVRNHYTELELQALARHHKLVVS